MSNRLIEQGGQMNRRDFMMRLALIMAGLSLGVTFPAEEPEVIDWSDTSLPQMPLEEMFREIQNNIKNYRYTSPETVFIMPQWYYEKYIDSLMSFIVIS